MRFSKKDKEKNGVTLSHHLKMRSLVILGTYTGTLKVFIAPISDKYLCLGVVLKGYYSAKLQKT